MRPATRTTILSTLSQSGRPPVARPPVSIGCRFHVSTTDISAQAAAMFFGKPPGMKAPTKKSARSRHSRSQRLKLSARPVPKVKSDVLMGATRSPSYIWPMALSTHTYLRTSCAAMLRRRHAFGFVKGYPADNQESERRLLADELCGARGGSWHEVLVRH